MAIPRTNRTNKMNTDRRACGWGRLGRTVENPADETPGEIRLLDKVCGVILEH